MRRPSPALVVAVIALIVAMSGTSYAVTQLPRNSVGTTQLKKNAVTAVKIKNNAVTTAKIRNNAVTGAKVRDGSLTAADFAAGTLLQGEKGDAGAPGAPGLEGPQGPQGPPGPSTSTGASSSNTLQLDSTWQPVVMLSNAGSGYQSTGTLELPEASNVVLVASVSLSQVGSMGAEVTCRAEYRPVSAGSPVVFDIGAGMTTRIAVGLRAELTVTALAALPADTYDMRVACNDGSPGSDGANVISAAMTVTATGQ